MPHIRINKENLSAIKLPETGQVFYWDKQESKNQKALQGFGVKATPTGLAFVVQDRVNGKTCRTVIGKYPAETPDSARKLAQEKLSKLGQGVHLNDEKRKERAQMVTLREAFEDFKASRELRPETLKGYEGAMRRSFADWMDKPVTEITKDMIQARHKKLSAIPEAKRKKQEWKGEAAANLAMRTLRSVLNYAAIKYENAEGRSILPENPVKRLSQARAWNKNHRRQDVVPDDELKFWYQAVQQLGNDTMRDYFLLCIFAGLRATEAATLTWSNVELKNRKTAYLRIDAKVTKNGEEHRLPLSDSLFDMLTARDKERRDKERGKVVSISSPLHPYVFPGERPNSHIVESKWSVAKVIKAWTQLRKDAGINDELTVAFTLHTLRRTFATVAERLDISHYSLKKLLNHKNASDVTAGYAVVSVEDLREPMQKICDHVKKHAGIRQAESAAKEQA